MAGPIPTKKIPQLTAYGVPLQGNEMLEIWATNASRRVTARNFVLPIDSLLTLTGMGGTLPASRQLVSSSTVVVQDNGPGSTVQLNALIAGALPGNPTAQVGLAAVNGVATTWMRSDAAPALSQAITPTWTGQHVFTQAANSGALVVQGARGIVGFNETDAAANNQRWRIAVEGERMAFEVMNDAATSSSIFIAVERTFNVVDSIDFTSTQLLHNGSPIAGGITGLANPTASVGLTAVNGAATTAMRSDAAPALSQAITPTWTNQHIFTAVSNDGVVSVQSVLPSIGLVETDAAADNRRWRFDANAEQFNARVADDTWGTFNSWLLVDRTGATVDRIRLQSNGGAILDVENALTFAAFQGASAPMLLASSANPSVYINETDAPADEKLWRLTPQAGEFQWQTRTDVNGAGAVFMSVTRTGTAIDSISFTAAAINLNGVAVTDFARLSQSNVFTAVSTATAPNINLSSTAPRLHWNETDGAANNRTWVIAPVAEQLRFFTQTDDGSGSANWLTVDRTGTVVDAIALASTALTWNGNPVSTAVGANPTASLGLTAVNGVATTYMRSDAAPALSQSIAPTWTGVHTFTNAGGAILLSSGSPAARWNETDAAVDNRLWAIAVNSERFVFTAINDANNVTTEWLSVDRTGTAVDALSLPVGTKILGNLSGITVPSANEGRLYLGSSTDVPLIGLANIAAAANNRLWDFFVTNTGELSCRIVNDIQSSALEWLAVTRTAVTVDSVAFPTGTNFLFGTSAALVAGNRFQVDAPANTTAVLARAITASSGSFTAWNSATAGDNVFITFGTEGSFTTRGSITYNRGSGVTAYNTTSDARRKKNIRNSRDSADVIDAIRVRAFDWNDSDNHVEHWIVAQELYDVFPMAVTPGGADRDWAVDPSKLVPLLIKEVQSLRARVTVLEQ